MKNLKIIIASSALVAICLLMYKIDKSQRKSYSVNQANIDSLFNFSNMSPDTIISYNEVSFLKLLNDSVVCFSEIVLRQSINETGWFKSSIFINRNNAFGFRTDSGYCNFKSVNECVSYYKRFQEKYFWNGYNKSCLIPCSKQDLDYNEYYDFLEWYRYSNDDSSYCDKLRGIRL